MQDNFGSSFGTSQGVVVAVGAEDDAPMGEIADVIVPGDWRATLQPLHDQVSAGLATE